ERHGEDGGEDEAPAQGAQPHLGGALGPGIVAGPVDLRPVTGLLHRGQGHLGVVEAGDASAFGREVHPRRGSVDAVQRLLDPTGAGGARHSGDVDIDPAGQSRRLRRAVLTDGAVTAYVRSFLPSSLCSRLCSGCLLAFSCVLWAALWLASP